MAKLFCQKPSDIAILDDRVGEFGRFFFNRAIAAFGRGVHARLNEVATSREPAIAQSQKEREWERLMGGDEDSAAGFADPTMGSISGHAKVVGAQSDDEDIVVEGAYW